MSAIKIGRLSSSAIRLDDNSVSRMHAVIENDGAGAITIIDLGSERGVVVGRSKVSKQSLGLGDEVQIGVFSIVIVGIGEQMAPERGELPSAREKLRGSDKPKGFLSKLFGR